MLRNEAWTLLAPDLDIELMQAQQEGRIMDGLAEQAERLRLADPRDIRTVAAAEALCSEIQSRGYRPDHPYDEPDEPENILAACRLADLPPLPPVSGGDPLRQKIAGAWYGRCVGCLAGNPVEGWLRERICGLLRDTDNYPLHRYLSSQVPQALREKYGIDDGIHHFSRQNAWINNVDEMPEDDDINYSVLALMVLEKYGMGFTAEDVAEEWLYHLPYLCCCTAERVAYRNLTRQILPPQSAVYGNPFREYIGAQIRCDVYGYVRPGDPAGAAAMAMRDASVSAAKNGIYGSMFFAAVLAVAAVCGDPAEQIRTALLCVPQNSRFAEAIRQVLLCVAAHGGPDEMIDQIHARYDESVSFGFCHVIPNAMIVCTALLCAGDDLDRLLAICIEAGFDTDCNAATAGSVFGMAHGRAALPDKWTAPLHGRVRTGLRGAAMLDIEDLIDRTVLIAENTRERKWIR